MYIERKTRAFGTDVELMNDLHFILKTDGFIVNRFDFITKPEVPSQPERGKELIVERDQSFWSFNASQYSVVENLSDLRKFNDTASTIICGNFATYINSGYDANEDSTDQPKYGKVNTVSEPVCAALNKEGRAKYTIYSSTDGWDYLVVTEFDGYTTFVAFGNKSKGVTDQGNYHIGSYFNGRVLGIPTDLNTTLASGTEQAQFPQNPFQFDNSIMPLFFVVDTFDNDFSSSVRPQLAFQNPGRNITRYSPQLIKGFANDYSGINVLGEAKFYVNKVESNQEVRKTFYDFDFGWTNMYTVDNREERTINGKRYKFFHLCKRIDNQNFEATVNKGHIAMWIELGDKRV